VVSKPSAGLRGTQDTGIGKFDWKLGAYRTTNSNDILNMQIRFCRGSAISRMSARRAARHRSRSQPEVRRLRFHASYAFVDARFLDSVSSLQ